MLTLFNEELTTVLLNLSNFAHSSNVIRLYVARRFISNIRSFDLHFFFLRKRSFD